MDDDESFIACPKCGGKTIRRGKSQKGSVPMVDLQCKICDKYSTVPDPRHPIPKIFVFDIETSTILAHIFSLKINGYISPKNIEHDWFALCWAGKWLMTGEKVHDIVTPGEAKKRNDRRVSQSLWNIFDTADVLVGHNLKRFDTKKMSWRFEKNDLGVPRKYRMYDTLTESRKAFGATSHSLDFIGKEFKLNGKHKTDIDLWKACSSGEPKALSRMNSYCIHDVEIGVEWYLRLRKWSMGRINLALYTDMQEPRCPVCLGKVEETGKIVTTGANRWPGVRCACGWVGRGKESLTNIEQRRRLKVE